MTAVITPRPAETAPVEPTRVGAGRRSLRLLGIAAPGLILATALHVRSPRPMTMDESFTVLTSGRSWWSLVRGCTTDPGMSVYYLALKAWATVAGASVEHLRWFSLVAVAVLGFGIASISERRGRASLGLLGFMGFAMTPMVREASVDARAAAFGAALSVWLVVAFDRWLGGVEWPRRRIVVLLAGSVAVAFVHPSTLFVGVAGTTLMWRWARREGDRTVARWSLAAFAFVGLGAAAAALRSGDADSVVSPGFKGVVDVFSQLPGGRALAGLAFVATIGLLLAGRAFDDERVVRWFAGAAILWFAAAAVAFPVRSVFVPRYFVAAAALLLLALLLAEHADWSTPVIMATVALVVVGGAAQVRNDYGFGSTWCAAADGVARVASPADRIVLGSSAYASPVLACLGEPGVELFTRASTLPALSVSDLEDPRALWTGMRPEPNRLLDVDRGGASVFVWLPGTDAAIDDAVGDLGSAGVACSRTMFGHLAVARCVNG